MIRENHRQWFFSVIIIVTVLFGLILFFFLRRPVLFDVQPPQSRPGEITVVNGRFLGRQNPQSTLSVGNQRITASHILTWEPSRISFRMPDGVRSGDVLVSRNQRVSNPILLTNINTIPRPDNRSDNHRLIAQRIEGQYDSYWEIEGNVDFTVLDIYVDGDRIPSAHRFSLPENRIGLYVPAFMLSPIGNISDSTLLSRIELRPRDLNHVNESLELGAGNGTVLYDNAEGSLLYQLRVIFNGSPETDYVILCLPLPEIDELSIRLESSFPGWVQLLPFAEEHVCVRLFPHNALAGSVMLNVHGEIVRQRPSFDDDDYDTEGPLLSIYEDYLEPADEPVLNTEQRRALNAALNGVDTASARARAVYDWFSREEPGNTAAFVDELRRRNIAARVRIGYVVIETPRFNTTTWVEIFLPRWGWLPLYRESMAAGAPFAEALYDYFPLPIEEPFPVLYDAQGEEIEGMIRPSISF